MLASSISSLNPWYLAVTILLYYLALLLYSLRLSIIAHSMGLPLPLSVSFAANLSGVAFANLLPGFQVLGEAVKIAYVRWRLGRGAPEATAAIMYDKVVEAIPLTAIALAALASAPALKTYATAVAVLAVALVAGALLLWDHIVDAIAARLERRGYNIPADRLKGLLRNGRLTLTIAGLATATWLLIAARIYAACKAADIDVTPSQALLLTTAYIAASAPSATPGNLGLIEATMVIALKELVDTPTAKAVAAVAAERIASYLSATATGLLTVALTGAWDAVKPVITRRKRKPATNITRQDNK